MMDSDTDVKVNSDTVSSADGSDRSDSEDDHYHESEGGRSESTSDSSQEAGTPNIRENTLCTRNFSASSYSTDLKPTMSNLEMITSEELRPFSIQSETSQSSCLPSSSISNLTQSSLVPSTSEPDISTLSLAPPSSRPKKTPSSLVSSTSVSNSVRPVGGSVLISTDENTLEASGDQVLEMTGALMQRARDSDYTLSMETVQQALTGAKEVHFNMSRTDIHKPTAVTFGGDVHVRPSPQRTRAPEPQGPPNHLQKLKNETETSFKRWTEGMVMTKAAKTVLNKVVQGQHLVTVTGCPGEGKTTAGYLVLKHLHDRGREVFDIKTPDDYFKVKTIKHSVILLNDIFGVLSYDYESMKKWQNVLGDLLALSEHKQEDRYTSHRFQNNNMPKMAVILICRSSVLKEASEDMGKYKHLMIQKENVVDVTELMKCEASERIKIWKYHAARHNVNIDSRLVREVCSLDLSHGFPHCCRLFADMYSKNKQLDMKHFFTKPLEFLQHSMESLLKNSLTGPLLREMLKNDGSLDLESIDDLERQYQYSSKAESLKDTYLALNGRIIEFHHPSVYDCAAFVICQKSPSFVITHCSLSFLNERVKVKGLTQENKMQSHHIILIDSSFGNLLLKRFHKEFLARNIEQVLSHSSFFDECFVFKFIEYISPSIDTISVSKRIKDLCKMHDKHSNKSFLFLMTKSGSDKILRYIHQYVELTEEEQREALFGACEHSSVLSLEFLLQRYNDLNLDVTDSDNQTPLLIATQKRSQEVIRTLLMRNVNVNVSDNKGRTPLFNVCLHGVDGDGSVVKMLFKQNADILQENDSFQILFPLQTACWAGHINIVENLMLHDAVVNEALVCDFSSMETTPLHCAAMNGHADVASLLLNKGLHINLKNKVGATPLHLACLNGHGDIVFLLLDEKADINTKDKYHNTPLHFACLNGNADIASLLLEKGADVNKTNDDGNTVLHLACRCQHVDVVSLLLQNGVEIEIKDGLGNTALHLAFRYGYDVIMSLLLDKGADINTADSDGDTTLHLACRYGNSYGVSRLLDNKADINITDRDGNTSLHLAYRYGYVDFLVLFLDKGVDINKIDSDGDTILHLACRDGNIDVVSHLLQKGANVNGIDGEGNTTLHLACRNRHDHVVSLLLDEGVDFNKTDRDGDTPLHLACGYGFGDIVSLLLVKDINTSPTDRFGNTPLHLACLNGHADIESLLLQKGADVNKLNNAGDTPGRVIQKTSRDDVMTLFLRDKN